MRHAAAFEREARFETQGSDEIAELARALDTSHRALRSELHERTRREQALRDFLANTTHDVMVPLTVLLGHLSSLRDSLERTPEERATLGAALDEAHYVASLLQNLALTAALDSAEPRVERATIDVRSVVERVIARHAPIARELHVSLDYGVPPDAVLASADATMLEQAVSNLTYNALRYNHAAGHVAVLLEVAGAPSERTQFTLSVIDDGPGVDPALLGRLLERGLRTDAARARAPEGKGLGLSIAQRIAELHGFRLTLDRPSEGGFRAVLSGPTAS